MSALAVLQTATTTWNLDPTHSVAEFKVKHMMISNVEGQFATVTVVPTLDKTDHTNSSVEASIEMASVNTRDAQRDTHPKSTPRIAGAVPAWGSRRLQRSTANTSASPGTEGSRLAVFSSVTK